MRARARIRAELDDRGRTVLAEVRSDPPLVIRATGSTVHLVGGAAGPLGGDDLVLEVVVGEAAGLTVRSAAASLVLPGRPSRPSRSVVEISVAKGARLDWRLEPVVSVAGSDHRSRTSVELADTAGLVHSEVVVLGRHGEGPGDLEGRLDLERAGQPLLRHRAGYGSRWPGWEGPGGTAGRRVVATAVEVGVGDVLTVPGGADVRAVRMALGPDASMMAALAHDHHALVSHPGVAAVAPGPHRGVRNDSGRRDGSFIDV